MSDNALLATVAPVPVATAWGWNACDTPWPSPETTPARKAFSTSAPSRLTTGPRTPVLPEAELDKLRKGDVDLLTDSIRQQLQKWWLEEGRGKSKTPSWDIASTCTISGRKGLLLVEAKAHSDELSEGDRCSAGPTNRKQIGKALQEANNGLQEVTGGSWRLSAEHRYQLANRFAWSWKLATLGIPVVLVYLGFLDAVEMSDRGRPFESDDDWRDALREYYRETIDAACWEQPLDIGGTPLLPLMRSDRQPFEPQ